MIRKLRTLKDFAKKSVNADTGKSVSALLQLLVSHHRLVQALVFFGFHGRSSSTALRLSQQAALEQRLAALQEDNAQLRAMYKHLEGQLSLASAELGCELD